MTIEDSKQISEVIIKDAAVRLVAGILHKNVKRHIESQGIPNDLSDKMMELAVREANNFSHYKIGEYSKEFNNVK